MVKQISSIQNPLIKELFLLKEKSRARKNTGRFLIEGIREISLAIRGNYEMETILFDPSISSLEIIEEIIDPKSIEIIEITSAVYKKLAYRSTTEGIIAISKTKGLTLSDIKLPSNSSLILVAEAPEKPGNIGALLRTADAANVDAFLIANPKTDIYNPNIIRSSIGCVFTNQIAIGTTEEIIQFLKTNKANIYCAALIDNAEIYSKQDYTDTTAFVLGTEAVGLSQEWLENSYKNVIIPMQGEIDSMNVSVSAGILIFEAKRQRGFN
jgi:TrmH family RNA methyltransferase